MYKLLESVVSIKTKSSSNLNRRDMYQRWVLFVQWKVTDQACNCSCCVVDVSWGWGKWGKVKFECETRAGRGGASIRHTQTLLSFLASLSFYYSWTSQKKMEKNIKPQCSLTGGGCLQECRPYWSRTFLIYSILWWLQTYAGHALFKGKSQFWETICYHLLRNFCRLHYSGMQ